MNSGAGGFDSHALPPTPVPVPVPELTLREYQPGDEVEILATFNRVFARVDPTFRPRTLAFWRWQFLENPSGSLVLLAVTPDGCVVGQLANVLQRVRFDGRPATFSQAVDSMSDPAFRQGLSRGSLQAQLGNAYAEKYAGPAPGQHALLWGVPVPVAWRVGRRFIRYDVIRTQLKLRAPPVEVRVDPSPGVDVAEVARVPEEVAELFERAAGPHGAIALRDQAQLDWRWSRHPERDYTIAIARRAGRLVGYAVYTRGDFDGAQDEGLVCDWLVPPDEESVGHALRAWLAERGRADGVALLTALFPDTVAEWIAFQRAGFHAAPTGYFLVGRECVRGYDMRWMHDRWYYTLGDTDLV